MFYNLTWVCTHEGYFKTKSFLTQRHLKIKIPHYTYTTNAILIIQVMKLTCFGLRSPTHLKLGDCVGDTQWGAHHTCLKPLVYEDH
jgi:hypothetical protein